MPIIKVSCWPFLEALKHRLTPEQKYELDEKEEYEFGTSEECSIILKNGVHIEPKRGVISVIDTQDGLILRVHELSPVRSRVLLRFGNTEIEKERARKRMYDFNSTGKIDLRPYEHIITPNGNGIAPEIRYSISLIPR